MLKQVLKIALSTSLLCSIAYLLIFLAYLGSASLTKRLVPPKSPNPPHLPSRESLCFSHLLGETHLRKDLLRTQNNHTHSPPKTPRAKHHPPYRKSPNPLKKKPPNRCSHLFCHVPLLLSTWKSYKEETTHIGEKTDPCRTPENPTPSQEKSLSHQTLPPIEDSPPHLSHSDPIP